MNDLHSKRLRLINATGPILEAALKGDTALSEILGVEVPPGWSTFGDAPFRFVLARLSDHPGETHWWTWLPILKDQNMLIGNCGYKGTPKDGMVEIGYDVVSSLRGIGLATEIAAVLIDHAFSFPEVEYVQAHTLAEENASCGVLKKCGFKKVAEINDPDDGDIWQWKKMKEQ